MVHGISQTVTIFRGNGAGGFQPVSGYAVGYSADSLVLTDYGGDGNVDIWWAKATPGS